MNSPIDSKTPVSEVEQNRRIERLRDRLELKFWSIEEARLIVFGADPETTLHGETQGWRFSWLPDGDKNRPKSRQSWVNNLQDDDTLSEIHKYLKGEGTPYNRSPSEWIAIAVKYDLTPPWLPFALQDRECREKLSKRILKAFDDERNYTLEGFPDKKISEHMSSIAKNARKDSPKGKAMALLRENAVKELTDNPNKLCARGDIKKFAGELLNEHVAIHGKSIISEASIQNVIRRVKRDLEHNCIERLGKTSSGS